MRYLLYFLPIFIAVFFIADRVYIRTMTAEKQVVAVSLSKESVYPLLLEDQEIVNDDSISAFAQSSLSTIFNFKPGQAEDHINSDAVKELFISEEYHNLFSKQFIEWSNMEFQINNISIKETIVKSSTLYRSPPLQGGARVWKFEARLPFLNRAVGGTNLEERTVDVYMVYLGHQGGLGIYGVGLR